MFIVHLEEQTLLLPNTAFEKLNIRKKKIFNNTNVSQCKTASML